MYNQNPLTSLEALEAAGPALNMAPYSVQLIGSTSFTYCKDRSRTERQPQEARVFVPVETYTA